MSLSLLVAVVSVLGLALLVQLLRRAELGRMERSVREREQAVRRGSDQAQLQHPVIDLSRCLGCGKCVAVCPEDGVLEMVHGQAVVVNGARCVGVAACERECPVAAITITIANLETRTDIPVVNDELEAAGSPGLFLAGEITAHALIKTAIDHGVAVASTVARRLKAAPPPPIEGVWDLCIVGAGPAGLACALEAKRRGLDYVVFEHENALGGTIAKYPRRKLVVTQPIEMPLHGRLKATTFTKEELMELWGSIARQHAVNIQHNELFTGVEREPDGTYVVRTETGGCTARNVCLALGRRGVPRRLGVPGEELPKVAYSLLDAQSYQGRRILVVGGGDSAIETAVGLAEQPGNEVTLSYRREGFVRVRSKSQQKLDVCVQEGRIGLAMQSNVLEIRPDAVDLAMLRAGQTERVTLPNDEVFVMAGGIPPFEVLERSGVSFDAKARAPARKIVEQGTGLLRALSIGFGLATSALIWVLLHWDYYGLPLDQRFTHPDHPMLRPAQNVGLWMGIAAVLLIAVNLLYLVRRSTRFNFTWGSFKLWMTSHVATGILALLCAMVHSAMAPKDSLGGHAFWSLAALLVTGAIGRYFYAWVPRAANGRELELAEVQSRLDKMFDERRDGQHKFLELARNEVSAVIETRQWKSSFLRRVFALVCSGFDLRGVLSRLTAAGKRERVPADRIKETVTLAKRAHHLALMAAHYEDLRAILGTWRWLHRWAAWLMVVLVVVHVFCAFNYGAFD